MSGERRVGKYDIEWEIARGGMGTVYAARHSLTKNLVALKVLGDHAFQDDAAYERFLGEVRAAALIGHPGIVKVYDAGRTEDDRYFIAMELLDGESFEERIDLPSISREDSLHVILEMLGPLSAAHDQRIVHRDLKPENVFIHHREDGRPEVKLLDFGIARDTKVTRRTSAGISMGTPHYMSPEQATTPSEVGPAGDVWSVGVMMYEALSGRMPFGGETAQAVLVTACTKPHQPLATLVPEVSAEVSNLVDACLEKNAAHRPKDARALGERLSALLAVPKIRATLTLTAEGKVPRERISAGRISAGRISAGRISTPHPLLPDRQLGGDAPTSEPSLSTSFPRPSVGPKVSVTGPYAHTVPAGLGSIPPRQPISTATKPPRVGRWVGASALVALGALAFAATSQLTAPTNLGFDASPAPNETDESEAVASPAAVTPRPAVEAAEPHLGEALPSPATHHAPAEYAARAEPEASVMPSGLSGPRPRVSARERRGASSTRMNTPEELDGQAGPTSVARIATVGAAASDPPPETSTAASDAPSGPASTEADPASALAIAPTPETSTPSATPSTPSPTGRSDRSIRTDLDSPPARAASARMVSNRPRPSATRPRRSGTRPVTRPRRPSRPSMADAPPPFSF
ncbi:MAG: protein kinase [Myxococcota bacterium]